MLNFKPTTTSKSKIKSKKIPQLYRGEILDCFYDFYLKIKPIF
ncbi:hypothetical protein LEP1GSC059_3114 [Leptospira noguchii serovar Panama str. CZ214]|uniref:Uncharacterized protein n=1 Tax=Leptospira noguchii serovar Panama str. CZ214 TaxID=1001595 RepID=T0GPX8_9LEPT|nr:hypothetical protein LEP1GSC059_3114 [Leptospira noguchii serovar Panama str. CZ214]